MDGASLRAAYPVQNAQERTTMQVIQERCRSTSFALTPEHLAWLDAKRQHGAISRSAALRQALDELMATEPTQQPQRNSRP